MIFETNKGQIMDLDNNLRNTVIGATFGRKKVSSDISKIKKIDKVYSMYGIPRNEKIIAFCKSNTPLLPITMDGIIFTDYAMHFYATLEKDTSSKIRNIPYSALGHYIFTQAGAKGNVCAHSVDGDVQIFGGTIFAENTSGAEILKVVKEIQNTLRQRDCAIEANLENLATSIIEKAQCDMLITELPSRLDLILNAIIFDHHFTTATIDAAATVQAEYLFRQCDLEKYHSFVESLPSLNVSFEVKRNLINIPELFVSNFISILTNLELDFDYSVLSKYYKRLDNIESLGKQYQIIRTYISIRMNEFDSAERSINYLRKNYGDDVANRVEWFKGIFCYHQMQNVYEAMQKQGELTSTYATYRDGLGLTPLHYALINKNETAISYLLEKTTWKNSVQFPGNEMLAQFYDYIILACGKQISNPEDLLEKTHPATIEIKKRAVQIQKKIKELNVKLQIQKTNLSIGRSKRSSLRISNENAETIEELTEKIEALVGYIEETEQSIKEYAEELQACEQELALTKENAIHDALETLGTMKECTDPLVQYLYKIYFEPNFFEHVLHEISKQNSLNLYHHNNFYFIAPSFAQIALPYLSMEVSSAGHEVEQSNDSIPSGFPPYGTSWFSPMAHKSINVLKAEYRNLAKLYHPDVSKHPDSKRLFQVISSEYNELSEILNQEN